MTYWSWILCAYKCLLYTLSLNKAFNRWCGFFLVVVFGPLTITMKENPILIFLTRFGYVYKMNSSVLVRSYQRKASSGRWALSDDMWAMRNKCHKIGIFLEIKQITPLKITFGRPIDIEMHPMAMDFKDHPQLTVTRSPFKCNHLID